MIGFIFRRVPHCLTVLGCVILVIAPASGQSKPGPQQQPPDDVVRINTELVQTDVMVFDKKGHFVDGLKAEQFSLKIDNKPQPISFFERVASGSLREEKKAEPNTSAGLTNLSTAARGRTIIFFIDDLHLSPESLARTRKALLEFIDHGMGENDQAAITSPSGQIGFLQQFTDDKGALRSAVARLNYHANTKTDMENPSMSEYVASKIRDGDEGTISFYVSEMLKQYCYKAGPGAPGFICTISTQAARQMVIERAAQIETFAVPDTNNTLGLLEGLMRTTGQLPGRKLAFLISDGFYLNDRNTGSREKIKRITDAAGRAGVVIYTLDARGLIGEGMDAANNKPIDLEGTSMGSSIGETVASQEGLNALARDTGGRPFRNTNAPMSEWVEKVLDETANYYLLAWRPDSEEQKRGKFNHIEVSITGRPDLTVRMRGAYFKTAPLPLLTMKKKPDKDPTKAREDDLRLVIDAPVSQRQIPTNLELRLGQVPGVGTRVTATLQVSREALTFALNDGTRAADLDVGGIFYNDKGKPLTSFVGRLRILPIPENLSQSERSRAIYDFHAWLPAGLYQVRVGVRDLKSGKIGSAMQWITIPNLSGH
jgi:VWFA-related protein